MIPDLQIIAQMPFLFHAGIFVLTLLLIDGWRNRKCGWGIPAMVMYGTVYIWYLLDYNKNFQQYFLQFDRGTLQHAMLNTLVFLAAFRFFLPKVEEMIVGGEGHPGARNVRPIVTADKLLHLLIIVWGLLFLYGMQRFRGNFLEALFPVGSRAEYNFLFARSAIGGGSSFLVSTASYTYKITCAMFGVLVWLPKQKKHNHYLNIAMILIAFPNFFFQGTRHNLVEVFGPLFLTFFLIYPISFKRKMVAGLCSLVILDFLLALMITYRNKGFEGILSGQETIEIADADDSQRHEGLNMFEELCYIIVYQQDGSYPIQYGAGYYAEIAQVVPRTFWPGKPTIGLDYALARGFYSRHTVHGVSATIALGIIGQGVANFGIMVGAVCAGFLAATWCGFLSRLRYQADSILRLCLYIAGIGFTINLGRGFSLLVLWPVVFGVILVNLLELYISKFGQNSKKPSRASVGGQYQAVSYNSQAAQSRSLSYKH